MLSTFYLIFYSYKIYYISEILRDKIASHKLDK